jgi:hypothetical protein
MSQEKPTNELANIAESSALSQPKVQQLLSQFGAPYQEASKIAAEAKEIIVVDENDTVNMGKARSARLELKNIRVTIEKKRKELKEESLREGKAIDGMANIIKAFIIPVEQHLEEQEKLAERKEAERKHQRHLERIKQLSPFVNDISVYSLEDMSQEAYVELLANAKQAYEDRQAAERKAEKDRVAAEKAEQARREEERLENERRAKKAEKNQERMRRLVALGMSLQEEVFKKFDISVQWEDASQLDDKAFDALAEQTSANIAKAQKKADKEAFDVAKKEAEERQRKEKEAGDARKAAEEERKKREELERQNKEREAQEKEQREEAETKKREALLAPDKEKLLSFADIIDGLEMPHVSHREAIAVVNETVDYLNRISKSLRKKAEEL